MTDVEEYARHGSAWRTSMTVTKVWRQGLPRQHAVSVTSAAGGKFTANLERGTVSWAEPDVWAFPGCHGLERYYCPGHGGGVCQYGACDEVRVTDLSRLRILAAAFERQERGALVAH